MPTPRTLISEGELQSRIDEIAREINRDYADSDLLICVGVLKGSVFFMVDLLKRVTAPVAVDFFQTASYGGARIPGEVRIKKDLDLSIRGRDVLLIEDIVDTANTLHYLIEMLNAREPASLRCCALVRKKERIQSEVDVDYLGFDIPDRWVVGYGLDLRERYRTLPYIGVVDP